MYVSKQGHSKDPGILPRALDVIFNSVGDRQMVSLDLKPNCFNRVVQMKDKDVRRLEEDKQGVFQLGVELEQQQQKTRVRDFSCSVCFYQVIYRRIIHSPMPT